MKDKNSSEKYQETFWSRKSLAHFFLGVGFILFILNITSILNILVTFGFFYPLVGYYTSTVASLFLMIYSIYNIYLE